MAVPGTSRPREARVRYLADAVVTVDGGGTPAVHSPGALDVVADRVDWVGTAPEVEVVGPPGDGHAPPPPDKVVRLRGLLMPGLVNTHGHSAMTLFRGTGDGLPLDRWLEEAIWPRERDLGEEDVRAGMLLGCLELLRHGVTTTCEQYFRPRALAGAALASGIRCVCTPAIFDLPGAGEAGSWQRCLAEALELHAELDGREGRLSIGFGPHSAYTLAPEGLVATAAAAVERDALVHIHVAETRAEEAGIRAAHGCSVPELLARLGVLEARILAAHAVWLSDADLELFARYDVAVAHCPQSNGKLGSGIARVADMLARGIRVGLGTDGPASNDNLDLWEELRLAPVLARATVADAGALTTAQALTLATAGGGDALGLGVGRLVPGALADMVLLDMDDPAFVPAIDADHLVAHLVWAASSMLVRDVWVGGRQVVGGGRCLTVTAAEVGREVTARARRLAATPV